MDVHSQVEDDFEPSLTCLFDHCIKMAGVFALRFSFSFLEETSLVLLVFLVEHAQF